MTLKTGDWVKFKNCEVGEEEWEGRYARIGELDEHVSDTGFCWFHIAYWDESKECWIRSWLMAADDTSAVVITDEAELAMLALKFL